MPRKSTVRKHQEKRPEQKPWVEFEDDDLIAATVSASTNSPNIPDMGTDRFATEVKALLESRAQSGWENESADESRVVFVATDYPRVALKEYSEVIEHVLDLPMTRDPVFGKLFLLSFNAYNGVAIALPCDINKILEWLVENGLGDRPVIVAYRDTLRFSVRNTASDDEPKSDVIRDKPAELTIDELKVALSAFHEGNLVSPGMCGRGVWKPGFNAKYFPDASPEKAIQEKLRVALWSWFRGLVSIGTEDSVNKGRIDVRLLAPPGESLGLRYWSIIELKVARSFGSTEKPVPRSVVINEIVKGVGQANEFTSDRAVEEGFLEIYDMRQDKTDNLLTDAKIVKRLNACTVTVNATLRPMYGTADEARNAGFYSTFLEN